MTKFTKGCAGASNVLPVESLNIVSMNPSIISSSKTASRIDRSQDRRRSVSSSIVSARACLCRERRRWIERIEERGRRFRGRQTVGRRIVIVCLDQGRRKALRLEISVSALASRERSRSTTGTAP
ncbi:hypothetical protein FOVG_19014 [Fusarium oxysporum f. sp. pisi HDV247]|uniref:Uncharacterized protein n=1 Tax=Fusarium oxysporum f. sp. pisi HDV247 TaxID=1080344 RepID=W9NFK2_FUSOX|nr:hypothetical protein FOVG_19014 [Fusarium oxysporum f. sp. pisi HDV247]